MTPHTPTPDASARTRIIEAAARVASDSGAGHLTIDAVAAQAGLSKGGVLYHFPNKRALLRGMLDELVESSLARVEAFREQLGDTPAAGLQARVLAESAVTPAERAMSMALLTAAAEDPDLVSPARGYLARTFASVREESPDPDLATVLLLAIEGLRYMNMLNLTPLDGTELERLNARMLRLATGDTN